MTAPERTVFWEDLSPSTPVPPEVMERMRAFVDEQVAAGNMSIGSTRVHTADDLFDCACFESYESYWTCPDCGNEKPRVDYRAPSCRCGATMILEVAEA